MADKDSVREKILRKQRKLEEQNLDREEMSRKTSARFNPLGRLADAITGESDYGTELSPAAEQARAKAVRAKFPDYPQRSSGYTPNDADVMKAGREAAAEERREAKEPRQYKKGGTVKSASSRADGCAVRGKTRGKIV